jgi:hypothetical protein
LSHLVRDEIFRAVSCDRDPEQFQARRSGKTFEFNCFAGFFFGCRPF